MFDEPRPTAGPPTLGDELQELRDAHRAARLEQVLGVLRDRRRDLSGTGSPPAGLTLAIDEFSGELARVRLGLVPAIEPPPS